MRRRHRRVHLRSAGRGRSPWPGHSHPWCRGCRRRSPLSIHRRRIRPGIRRPWCRRCRRRTWLCWARVGSPCPCRSCRRCKRCRHRRPWRRPACKLRQRRCRLRCTHRHRRRRPCWPPKRSPWLGRRRRWCRGCRRRIQPPNPRIRMRHTHQPGCRRCRHRTRCRLRRPRRCSCRRPDTEPRGTACPVRDTWRRRRRNRRAPPRCPRFGRRPTCWSRPWQYRLSCPVPVR